MTKKAPFFGPQNVREGRRTKMSLPSTGVIPINVFVAQTAFCILSTCKLARFGWKTTVGQHGVETTHEATGVKTTDVSVWHDTLWVLVEPYWEKDVSIKLEPVLFAIIGEMVSVLTPDEMAAHRLRGYIPFEPSCETCQSRKGCISTGGGNRTRSLPLESILVFAFIS